MAEKLTSYRPPLALTIVSSISIGVGALAALWILLDIIYRRGWRSMMAIMMPVYVINALYLWPITLWTYLNYGRPPKSKEEQNAPFHCMHHSTNAQRNGESVKEQFDTQRMADLDFHRCSNDIAQPSIAAYQQGHSSAPHHPEAAASYSGGDDHHHHNHGGGDRPMFATIAVAVCHCGAGCVLGDIIGEWIVYGANVTIRGKGLWPEYFIDFLFAIVIGILFQYFSIAPMSGEYGLKSFYRAAKADFLSLLFFEVGLFGWMAIFQVAIFQWKLEMTTITYWWMMQIGMFCGHWTGFPINWWLIKTKVKEPCA